MKAGSHADYRITLVSFFSPIDEADMTPQPSSPRTIGAPDFDPDALFDAWRDGQKSSPKNDDLRSSILTTFDLPQKADYAYNAIASVTLAQVQQAVEYGGKNGLHDWYRDENAQPV